MWFRILAVVIADVITVNSADTTTKVPIAFLAFIVKQLNI